MPTASEVIDALNLQPLPGEGGYFRQTWVLPSVGGRPAGTAIIYLITPDSFSALHRLDADEIFHYYLGDPCEQVVIDSAGQLTTSVLGPDVLAGQCVQTVVPQDAWQGTKLVEGGRWALVGTTMAPGYHHAGFELATKDHLCDLAPHIAAVATSHLADGA
jgi:predicted cupin superfamily sugar epimerase